MNRANAGEAGRARRGPSPRAEFPVAPVPRLVLGLAVAIGVVGASVATSCRAPEPRRWPFPEVSSDLAEAARSGDAGPVIAALRERVDRVESLYAELTLTIESAERSGVFEAVVYYEAPHRLRMTAFRDLLVSARDVFDLILVGDRYVLRLDDGEGGVVERGAVTELGADHAGFEVFRVLRERVFLPGRVLEGEPTRLRLDDGGLQLAVSTAGGDVTWTAEARTLGIQGATVRGVEGEPRVQIEYLGYRRVDGAFIPERFRLAEVRTGFSLSGWLRYVQVNPDLDSGIFEEPPVE